MATATATTAMVYHQRKTPGTKMMTAPNIGGGGLLGGGLPGGGGETAFVSSKTMAPFLGRRRTSISTITAGRLSSSSSSFADDSFFRGGDQQSASSSQYLSKQQRVPRVDEPNLFDIPATLRATYRPVPILLQIAIVIASAALVGRISLSQLLASRSSILKQLMAPITERILSFAVLRKALWFVLRTALLSTIAKLSILEAFYLPSRVTTQYLAERGELPSKLSKYSMVTPVPVSTPTSSTAEAKNSEQEVAMSTSSWTENDPPQTVPIGVHSIQYTQKTSVNKSSDNKYDGIYLHHGFGASSLSWLPILPSLVDKLGNGHARGVAHDAPGFGFTDRPDADEEGGLEQYGFENNVGIGLGLLNQTLAEQDSASDDMTSDAHDKSDKVKSIAIFGHSMGSKSALLMALHYASNPNLQVKSNLVVLVAPALEGVALPSRKGYGLKPPKAKQSKGWIRKLARRAWITWRKIFLDYPFRYGLRRLVGGTSDFWRKGLKVAWGNPDRLSDSDILRFQWPSIGKGWEEGLINFTRARILSSPSQHVLDDGALLREVANLKNAKVVIIYGSKDKVVRIEGSVAKTLRRDYPNVKVVRMEGLGHDPFEEDVDGFLLELEKAIE